MLTARSGRTTVTLVALIVAIGIAALLSLAVGARSIPLADTWNALVGNPTPAVPDAGELIWGQRFLRTALAIVVGMALGAAGALTQGHTRNPLADPGLLGVNAGAALAVCAATFTFGFSDPTVLSGAAFVGAGLAASTILAISARTSGSAPLVLLLAGVGLNAALIALTSALVLSDTATLETWRFWTVGSVNGRTTETLTVAAILIAFGLVAAIINAGSLNASTLGDDLATSLGGSPAASRTTGLLTITLLAAAATAACGPIAFLGLLAPHLARMVCGPDYRSMVLLAAPIGALLLLLCDVLGRVVAPPGEVASGIMVALIGAPFLIILLNSTRMLGSARR